MPAPAVPVEFVPGQFYFGETEIEIGGMEIRVQYYFLPRDPDELPYNNTEAEIVTFKEADLKLIVDGRICWWPVWDLLEEVGGGDLEDQLQAKLDDLHVEYVANDRPVEE